MAGTDLPFPRGKGRPTQSPVFWAQQKERYLRQVLIRDIEDLTGRRFVVFFANRFVKDSQIQSGDIAYVAEALGDCYGAPLDIMLETTGGETDATEAIISIIRQITQDLRVVVANAAKSNGTMLALSAKTIMMGITSELGPIEPSFGPYPVSTLLQDIVKEKDFALYMAGHQALRQSRNLAERLLREGMLKGKDASQIEQLINELTTRESFASHGSVIDRDEAERLGLIVERLEPCDPLWESVWLLYCMLDIDCRKANLAKVFEGRARSLAVAAVA